MLLTETLSPRESGLTLLHEGEGDNRTLSMNGIFIQADVKNANGRIYPLHEISSAVRSIQEQIKQGFSILGECDHPDNLNINIDRVSHEIIEMKMDGNNGMGKLKLLPTDKGKTIRALLESGIKLGVSSRGSGDVDPRGQVSQFEIVTVDIVAKPSAPNAYPTPVYESKQFLEALLEGKLHKEQHMVIDAIHGDDRAQQMIREIYRSWIDEVLPS